MLERWESKDCQVDIVLSNEYTNQIVSLDKYNEGHILQVSNQCLDEIHTAVKLFLVRELLQTLDTYLSLWPAQIYTVDLVLSKEHSCQILGREGSNKYTTQKQQRMFDFGNHAYDVLRGLGNALSALKASLLVSIILLLVFSLVPYLLCEA